MKIYNPQGQEIYDIQVDDRSVRYRSIMSDDSLTLNFSLTGTVNIPQFSYVDFEGARYFLWRPQEFKKHNTRNHEYTLTLHGYREFLKSVKFKDTSAKPYRLKFSLTAKPATFLTLLADVLNKKDSAGGWSAGGCIDGPEKTLSFNHEFCIDALGRFAQEWQTEFEFEGKKIHLRKVEKFKDTPLALSYGKGNGFLPGVGRYNEGNKQPVGRLFVEGGERNIDFSTYNSKSLLLPKSATLVVDGKTYRTDADGMFITRDGNTNTAEDSYDASEIYPKRVGTVSHVIVVDAEKHFYDIRDTSIPAALNYRDCRIAGEKAVIKFESGALAGREFDIEQTDTDLTGYIHTERRFKIVPQELDGHIMPGGAFVPAVGDKYAVFNISMPAAYISDNATKTGASWDMFREAARYFSENEADRFRFSGELDGIWSQSRWLEIGAKITPGGHVLFSDEQFQPAGVVIRIVAVKDYVNKPHKPEITLSNAPVPGSFSSGLAKLEADEVVIEESKKEVIRLTKRQWRDARETMSMLEKSLLNFSGSINPITVQTMQLVAGDESLQFRFVNSKTNPVRVSHAVTFNKTSKRLTAAAGILQHMSIGITTIKNNHAASEYKFWDMAAYTSPALDGSKAYYLYAKCSKTDTGGTFLLSETAIGMEAVSGFYHLLVGILNSERADGDRSSAPLYGFTEILPGRITTDKIISQDGKTYFDLLNGIIGGRIKFLSSGAEADLEDWAQNADDGIQEAKDKVDNLQIGGRNLLKGTKGRVQTGSYLMKSFRFGDLKPQHVERVTIMFKGELGEGKSYFGIYNSGGTVSVVNVFPSDRGADGIFRKSFDWKVGSTANTYVNIYHMPNSVTVESWIEDVMLVIGDKAAYYAEAPEDVQARIDEAIIKATYWSLEASAPVIYKDAANAATAGAHTSVTVYGELRSGTTATQGGFITITPNGGTEAGTAVAGPIQLSPANNAGRSYYTVRLYDTASKTTLLDTMTIPVVFKGASGVNAINVVLGNEADVLPASPEGVVSDYSGSGTSIRVFEGATELSYGTGNGQYQVSASGSGITAGAPSTSGNARVYGNASSMTADNATITFTVTGKTAAGASFSITKTQSFAKSRTGQKGDTGEELSSGKMLYKDPTFKSGANNTGKYDNAGGSTTFWERVAKPSDAPSDSTHIMRYRYEGAPSSPGFGGFYFGNQTRANAVFVTKIIAKIPIGKAIAFASNAYGTGGTYKWLTPVAGTGKYETYMFKVVCGASGSFSSTNYFYFYSGTSGAFSVEVAFATVYDMTVYDDTADMAMQSANAANTAVGNLNTYVDGAFKDGVIETSESKAIEKYINIVNSEKAGLEATYNKLYLNTYLEGTPKTNLLNAKVTYFGAVDNLISAINSAIADGKTTVAEKQNVDAKYSSYKIALSSLQSAIEEANRAIQDKINRNAKDLVTIQDTRNDNQTPNWYFINYSRMTVREFKACSVIGIAGEGIYCELETKVKWTDVSGGSIVQVATVNSGKQYRRYSSGTTTWTVWENLDVKIDDAKLTAEQAQLAAEGYMRARYIRDWCAGNTTNNWNGWNEIKVFLRNGTNIALGKPVTGGVPSSPSTPYSLITDGNTTNYANTPPQTPPQAGWVRIDLGQIYYDIDYIQVWHYWQDGRTYFGTKTEISVDGVNWTPVFDSAKSGTYKETEAGKIHSWRYAEVVSKANEAAAKTQYQASIEGGLIYAAIMKLVDAITKTETAGLSGLPGDGSLPALWAGGTYAQAIQGLAKAIIRHNGKSKFTDTEIEGIITALSGRIGDVFIDMGGKLYVNDAQGVERLRIGNYDLTPLAVLRAASQQSQQQNFTGKSFSYNGEGIYRETYTSPETLVITDAEAGSDITVTGSLSASVSEETASVFIELSIKRVGAPHGTHVEQAEAYGRKPYETIAVNSIFRSMPAGSYTFEVLYTASYNSPPGQPASNVSMNGSATSLKMVSVLRNDMKAIHIARNGLMAFYDKNKFLYLDEKAMGNTPFLSIMGVTDMPGVLLSATVASGGGWSNVWGSKQATAAPERNSAGRYTIYHTIGHAKFQISCGAYTENRSWKIVSKSANRVVVEWRTIGSSPALVDTTFDVTLTGNNYDT